MSDRAVMAAQAFPPGMSRLERLPDELKLRVGYYLMVPGAAKTAGAQQLLAALGDDIHRFSELRRRRQADINDIFVSWDVLNGYEQLSLKLRSNGLRYDDSMLALASTSTRLCNVFLAEHSKKYGPQNTLYRSIELGNVNLVRCAVECGADINKTGTKVPWKTTALQLAVQSEQLPVILYLLRRGADKADELVMHVLGGRDYYGRINAEDDYLMWGPASLRNHCRCKLLHALTDATLGSSQASYMSHTGPRLPRVTLEALAPNGRHLWFILRTCMRRPWGCNWKCDCGDQGDRDCAMRLISLLRRHGANWMACGPIDDTLQENALTFFLDDDWAGWERMYDRPHVRGLDCGLADLRRFRAPSPLVDDSIFVKPSVAGAMHDTLLENAAYRRDHCLPFLVAMLEHGVTAEQGDLSHAMDLASTPDTKQLSIAIVVALLRAGTDANEPGSMKTAMRLACMEATKDAAVAFVTLLLEHGADPGTDELRDEIQGAAEKWWIQSNWQSSGVFCRILRLLVKGGLDEHVAWEVFAVLGLDHGLVAEGGGGSTKV
ncbi:hypothetical protein INS49_010518 [Diaporthe citri]|uniref:uncharacterized protein n=1 Tax=Diaporthe citri TaxID=83186 RepID=UPI001C7FB329|nr:uncharacterized protein INS49_010518 [Diaporthe citri]KAG6362288.1 hypothetical protein INS49_010518 [Diaporthe citri]